MIECFKTGQETQRQIIDEQGRRWDLKAAPLFSHKGEININNIFAVIEVARDSTEQYNLELKMKQVFKMDALGKLAGGIAHDFNNIISAILGFAELGVTEVQPGSIAHGSFTQIIEAAYRAKNLTKSLSIFSRKTPCMLTLVNLNEILQNIIPLLQRLIRENITLKTNFSTYPITIMADPTQIEQIIINLATNSADAMPNGGIINISTQIIDFVPEEIIHLNHFSNQKQIALIKFSDNGCGIPESIQTNIFEPFFTTKPPGQGTGLGLSIVYGIVKAHNGHITFSSAVGKGTEFRIYLPIYTSLSKLESINHDTELTTNINTNNEKSRNNLNLNEVKTILLAEDFESMRNVIKTALLKNGFHVLEACNGQEAIKLFNQNADKISLIILDGIMPIKNGIEVFEEIRKLNSQKKVIFITGYIDELSKLEALADSNTLVLQKPVSPSLLINKVKEFIHQNS